MKKLKAIKTQNSHKKNNFIFMCSSILLFLLLLKLNTFAKNPDDVDMNEYVIKSAESFPRDGTHKYFLPRNEYVYDGCTTNVIFMNQIVMKGEPQKRTFCCGFTLEVFWKALNQFLKDFNLQSAGALTPEVSAYFMKLWFVREKNGDGPGDAMEKYGCGIRIPDFEQTRRGDFIQLWRHSGTGHSVILWDLIRDNNGKLKGFKYLSSQPKTSGIGFATEDFGTTTGLAIERCHISRMTPPSTWKNSRNEKSARQSSK